MNSLNLKLSCFLLLIAAHVCFAQEIPPGRTTEWSRAGYRGSIPVYATEKNIIDFGGNGNGIAANDMALQNAVASLGGQPGIVRFPPGTYLFSSQVNISQPLILKGEGAGISVLKFDLHGAGHCIKAAGNFTGDSTFIPAGALKGASVFTVSDASLFAANDYIKISQEDAGLLNDDWATGSVGQVLQIDSIEGNHIYFSNELRRNYSPADSAMIKKLNMLTGVGIECVTIKRMDATIAQTSNLFFENTANCWVKGVESDSCNFAHIRIAGSTNIEITNNYFHSAFAYNDGGKAYGISCEFTSGECLVENNIFKRLRHAMLVQSGANANVFAYNYSLEPFKTDTIPFDLSGDIVLHGNYPYLNLFEGNIVQNIVVDASHSINGPFNTFFRNRAESYGILMGSGAGDSTNIAGNEISGTGFLRGNYVISGNGNFEYGNNQNGNILPENTGLPVPLSFMYSSTPDFWNVSSAWPPIGLPNNIRSGSIPAKERYEAGVFTFCLSPNPAVYTFTGNGNWNEAANWSGSLVPPALLSPGSEIIIDPPLAGKCILNVPYVLNPAAKFIIRTGKKFEVSANLTFIK